MSITIDPKSVAVNFTKKAQLSRPTLKAGAKAPIMVFQAGDMNATGVATVIASNAAELKSSKLEMGFINIGVVSIDQSYYESDDPKDGAIIISYTKNKFTPCHDYAFYNDLKRKTSGHYGRGNFYNFHKNCPIAKASISGTKATFTATFHDGPGGEVDLIVPYKPPGKKLTNFYLVETKLELNFICVLASQEHPKAPYLPLETFKWGIGYHHKFERRSKQDPKTTAGWQFKNIGKGAYGSASESKPAEGHKFEPANIYNMVKEHAGQRVPCIARQGQTNKGTPEHFPQRKKGSPILR